MRKRKSPKPAQAVRGSSMAYSAPLAYGGNLKCRHRQRPFCAKRSMHVVYRSARARGVWSFLNPRHKLAIHALALDLAEHYDSRLVMFVNAGNHLHLALRFPSREKMQAFLRVFGQRLMFLVTGARKGAPKGKFFERIAFSRVVNWGREYNVLKNYFSKNALESFGVFSKPQLQAFWKNAKAVPL